MNDETGYTPPRIWTWDEESGGELKQGFGNAVVYMGPGTNTDITGGWSAAVACGQ